MIEQDINDSFPEDALVTWTCPDCGHETRVMQRFLEIVHCPACLEALFERIHAEQCDEPDSADKEVA